MSTRVSDHRAPIALVTGASRGIGREVCGQLADLGYTVLATARQPASSGVWSLDVTREDDIMQAFAQVSRQHGRLDVLVNNAAITYDTCSGRQRPTSVWCARRWRPTYTVHGA
jgi:NAD(P)-dependent dehydrogenase (short-subunit alcohol dehydrogenase family)